MLTCRYIATSDTVAIATIGENLTIRLYYVTGPEKTSTCKI